MRFVPGVVTVKMILKELKNNFLKYAKGFCFSENYSVFCTGRSAFICDRDFRPLYTVEKLSYVYYASISPNEKTLLLVSNSNIFYLVDLNDFSLKKYTVRDKYNDNLEGRGCWSFDGKSLYFNVCNRKTLNSALRRYDLSDDMSFKDLLEEKYWLVSIKPVKELNKYLLIGLDRKKAMLDRTDCWSMIWFDGTSFREFYMDVFDDSINNAEYEAATNTVIVYGHAKTFRCDLDGKIIEDMSLADPKPVTASITNAFENVKLEKDGLYKLKQLSDTLKLENISVDDSIYNVSLSSDGRRYYVGTHLGIFVIDAETKAVLCKEAIDYGVQNISEISSDIIAVSTWNGVKIFEIID